MHRAQRLADRGLVEVRIAQVQAGAQYVVELARALRAIVRRLTELHTVRDAAAIIDRQHYVSTTREILIQRVGVAVIVEVVPAEQHLAAGAAVEEDHGRPPLAGLCAAGQEQLPVNRHPVGRREQHRLRVDERGFRKGRRSHGGERTGRRGADLDHGTRRGAGAGADERDAVPRVTAVGGPPVAATFQMWRRSMSS